MNCNRCGIEISESAVERRRARGTYDGKCSDCRITKAQYQIKYEGDICQPWRGRVDEDFNPIDEKLKLYLPGLRTCGHKDCVNRSHVIKAPTDLELERNDISYRTGRQSQWEDFYKETA
jgi:hypothetical protein